MSLTLHHSKFVYTDKKFVGEISELGLQRFPMYVAVDGKEKTRLFGPAKPVSHAGEIVAMEYPQVDPTLEPKCSVHILND